VALSRLRKSDAKSKVIILLTDGDNNSGNISRCRPPVSAENGREIYTILAGAHDSSREADDAIHSSSATRSIPVAGTDCGHDRWLALSGHRHPRTGTTFQTSRGTGKVAHPRSGVLYAELYPRFLWPAFAVLLLEIVLRLSRLRRLP